MIRVLEYWERRQQLADRCARGGALCTTRRSPAIPYRSMAFLGKNFLSSPLASSSKLPTSARRYSLRRPLTPVPTRLLAARNVSSRSTAATAEKASGSCWGTEWLRVARGMFVRHLQENRLRHSCDPERVQKVHGLRNIAVAHELEHALFG